MQVLEAIFHEAEAAIKIAPDLKSLDQLRIHFLGKKGQLTQHLKSLGQLAAAERPAAGAQINVIKETIQQLIVEREFIIKKQKIAKDLASETLDITLPGRAIGKGSIHPLNQTIQLLQQIFSEMGFAFIEGPEIEDDFHNFTALNVPPLHPARAMQDTFYFPDGFLLRTQTSTVQVRAMKTMPLPLRVVALGRVYRRDFDLTHTPMFHQMECLVIDKQVTFADLKGMLHYFLRRFFDKGNDTPIRFRPSYFPFTEPSAEVDIGCINCAGKGCRICKQTGWLEVLGCGMVHPNVLKEGNIDIDRYRGFAFGVGIDRLTLLKYGITDLRALFENDLRFLKQF